MQQQLQRWAKETDAQNMEIMRNKNNNKQLLHVCLFYTHLYDRGVYNVCIYNYK